MVKMYLFPNCMNSMAVIYSLDLLSSLGNNTGLDLIRFENFSPLLDTNRDGVNTETVGSNIKSSYFIPDTLKYNC